MHINVRMLTYKALCVTFEPSREGQPPERASSQKEDVGEKASYLRWNEGKGDLPMFPMKKPIRLFCMVFQID